MPFPGDFTGVRLDIDLSTGGMERKAVEESFSRNYIGGRGYTSRLQYDLIPVKVDPLGADNKLIIAPGAFTGTSAASAGRFTFGGRSPLTGILGDANSGGVFGAVLRKAGFSLVIIHGKASHPVYIAIDNGHVEIKDARHLWGKDTHETTETIQSELGSKAFRVAAIGPAGEHQVRIAGIIVDKDHAAARTGLGAVMGSKNLKAIAVKANQKVRLFDPTHFEELSDELLDMIKYDKRGGEELERRGTLGTLMDHHNAIGGMNTRNYQFGFFEGKEKIDNDALTSNYLVRTTACYACVSKCDRYSRVKDGEYAGTEVGGPEYCTAVAFGSAIGNDNLAAILKGNDLINRFGMDAIDTGGVLAFAMELYQRGILTKEDTDGLDLSWGNYHAALELVRQIAYRSTKLGDLLAYGVRAAAEEIGRGAIRYAVEVKNMTPAPLDARVVKVYNFRYAEGSRGADHLRISVPAAYTLDTMPAIEAAEKLRYWQTVVTVPDLMGVCKFPYTYYTETVEKLLHKMLEVVPELYNAATGFNMTGQDLLRVGSRLANIERAHNARLGLTSKDDYLPARFTEDPMPSGPAAGKIYDILDPLKVSWYTVQGWNPVTGIPRRETLEKLDLADIASDLANRGIEIG